MVAVAGCNAMGVRATPHWARLNSTGNTLALASPFNRADNRPYSGWSLQWLKSC